MAKPKKEPKGKVIGFIVIDELTGSPLAFKQKSLLSIADAATFFEIVSARHGEHIKTSPRAIEYSMTRRRAEKVISKHHVNLAKLAGSAMMADWDMVKNAQKLKPKLVAVRKTPEAAAVPVPPACDTV